MSEWQRYGRVIAGPSEAASERLERGLGAGPVPPVVRARSWRIAMLAAAAAIVVIAIGIAWPRSSGVVEPSAAVRIATGEHEQQIALPHAGTLVVRPGASVELEVSEVGGAIVRLHEGAVMLDVQRHEGARWIVDVDAFRAEALGTRFHVRRTDGPPEVAVEEGVVRLTGPGLPDEGLNITAEPTDADARRSGAHADASAVAPRSADTAVEPSPSEPEPSEPSPVEPEPSEPSPSEPEPPPSARATKAPAWLDRFRDAIGRGDPNRALEQLPTAFPTGREPIAAADFLDAGDALVAAHEDARAERAYRAACGRRTAAACGVATFRRALMRARAGDYDEAITLASRYLEDHPRGSLVLEALGRRMQWRFDHGASAAAHGDAEVYLERWPDGPHAELARRIGGAGR